MLSMINVFVFINRYTSFVRVEAQDLGSRCHLSKRITAYYYTARRTVTMTLA